MRPSRSRLGGRTRTSPMKLCCVPNFGITRVDTRQYAEQHVVTFLEELAAGLGGVVLCAPEVAGSERGRLHGCEIRSGHGLSTVTRPWPAKHRVLFYGLSVFWLLPTVLRSDYLYVFLPGRLGVLAAALAVIVRRPYGVYLRGSRLDLFGSAFTLSRARFVLAAGPFLRDVASRYCDSCDVVSPMFDIKEADLAVSRVQREQRGTWRLLYVGALEEAKGTFELIDAVGMLRRRGRLVELDLVGNWVNEDIGKTAQAESRGEGAVRFRGAVDDRSRVRAYYVDADLFVFPSHSEGFPRVLYEAMCFGLPAVTTMVDGIPSVMKAGVNCLAVQAESATALADAIDEALADVALRRRIAAGGLATMRAIFARHKTSHARQVIERVRRPATERRADGETS